MWESVVNSSSGRERASEWASEWTSEQWRKQRVLYYISVLFYSLHRSSTAGDDDDDDDTEIAITEHMIAGESESPVLLFAILHISYITAQARPLYHCTCPDLRRAKFFVFRYRRWEKTRGAETRWGDPTSWEWSIEIIWFCCCTASVVGLQEEGRNNNKNGGTQTERHEGLWIGKGNGRASERVSEWVSSLQGCYYYYPGHVRNCVPFVVWERSNIHVTSPFVAR